MPEHLEPSEEFGGLPVFDFPESRAAPAEAATGRLETSDVSMGTLSDNGAAALLAGQPLTHRKTLDMHHNFLSSQMCARLRETLEPGVLPDVDPDYSGPHSGDGEIHRYISVSE